MNYISYLCSSKFNQKIKMKELELKHLYFANNGKVRLTRLPHWDFKEVELQNCELCFNGTSKEPYLRHKDVTFGLDQIKIYARPLSDLAKEIDHNGEKFVPLDILSFGLTGFDKKLIDNQTIFPEQLPHYMFEKLLEWHFDVFDLHSKKLCIYF